MTDRLTSTQRSAYMSKIRSKGTRPEMVVRQLVHGMGYRYRLHVRKLPGCPDIVFPKSRTIILIQGCFWHQHSCNEGQRVPKSRLDYWIAKITGNVRRDRMNRRQLRRLGWRVLVIWECQTAPRNEGQLVHRLKRFLQATP